MDWTGDIDVAAVRRYRLSRVKKLLHEHDVAAVVTLDPINLRYVTGSRNMQVWTMHNFCRYGFTAATGPNILFELSTATHLTEGLEVIDEVRPSLSADYLVSGPRADEIARRWAREIADLVRTHGGGNMRLAIDRLDVPTVFALQAEGLELVDGKMILEHARSIKSLEEIRAFKRSLESCDASVAAMREQLRPGMREEEALAILLQESISRGGEYQETRLLTSGPRTNPWFQETSNRPMKQGDLISFDTDLIGPMGFYNDISRSWILGDAKPTNEQKHLYQISREQLEKNISLLRPGTRFLDFTAQAYVLPDEYLANRYADVGHGCGLGVEYPFLWYPEDADAGAYDGMLEENMIVCIESYVGEVDGSQGVKLEQPAWITAEGPVILSDYPLEDDF